MRLETDVAVVGAGGCGLVAALAAAECGARVVILERENRAGGNTEISAGLVIAADSRLQKAAGENGTPEELAEDIWKSNRNQSERQVTLALCRASGPTLDWMIDLGVPFELLNDYRYPGHTHFWLHGTRERHGEPIVRALLAALERFPQIRLCLSTRAMGLVTDDNGAVVGVSAQNIEGNSFTILARQVILAADGFGANRAMVTKHIPEMAHALYYGAPGCTGDAIQWGMQLGAAVAHMDSYQPHSSVAYPERVFVTSYIINSGGIQVNRAGKRFGDETKGYAEHALAVLQQNGAIVYEIFDARIRQLAEASYPRFYECANANVLRSADTIPELAARLDLDPITLEETIQEYNNFVLLGRDRFGRTHFGQPLAPPFYAIQVTSALFHTQGGLVIDTRGRVKRPDGSAIPNLYAGGGTAAGFSGNGCGGYLAGVGLLSAFALGKICGEETAQALQ